MTENSVDLQDSIGRQVVEFNRPVKWEYAPQPDITTYELAQLFPVFFNPVLSEHDWQRLGSLTRHFIRY